MKHMTDIPHAQLSHITGGDWVETTFGFMIGAALVAGFLGSGGMLGLAVGAGGLLMMDGSVL